MKKQKKVLNMQRRRKEQSPLPQETAPKPAAPDFNDEQLAEFMAQAEAAFTSTGSQTRYFVHGPVGLQSQQEPDGTWLFPIQDGLNSVRSVADENLAILDSLNYDPFGNPFGVQGMHQTPYGFTGEMSDPNDLVYLRGRYYDPALGVFPSLDPLPGIVEQAMSLNPYAYAQNNPVNWVDPSGNVTIPNVWDTCSAQQGPKPCPPNGWAAGAGECCFQYNRFAARDYAFRHAPSGQSNPVFCEYPTTCAGGDSSDCSNFVSQAMWAGGHPMNYPEGINRFSATIPITDSTEGWACRSTQNDPNHCWGSQNWRGAKGLATSYLPEFGLPSETSTVLPDFSDPNDEKWQQVIDLGRALDAKGIGFGDILYIPTPSLEHVALIVGWGPLLKSWRVLHALNKMRYDYSISLSNTYQDGYVPYVVDHGIQRQTSDQSLARPYYFLNWSPTFYSGLEDYHEVYSWTFQKLPDLICKPANDVITLQEGMTRVERT